MRCWIVCINVDEIYQRLNWRQQCWAEDLYEVAIILAEVYRAEGVVSFGTGSMLVG